MTTPQRNNHTDEGMKPCATGYWYREEDVNEYLPTRPQPFKFITGLMKLGIIVAISLNVYFTVKRIEKLEKEMIIQGYSKDFCKGY